MKIFLLQDPTVVAQIFPAKNGFVRRVTDEKGKGSLRVMTIDELIYSVQTTKSESVFYK